MLGQEAIFLQRALLGANFQVFSVSGSIANKSSSLKILLVERRLIHEKSRTQNFLKQKPMKRIWLIV